MLVAGCVASVRIGVEAAVVAQSLCSIVKSLIR